MGDDDRDAEMARRYHAGESMEEIGQRYGVTHQRVSQILKRAEVAVRKGGFRSDSRTRATPEQIAAILRLRDRGKSIAAIAAELSIGETMTRSVLRYHGDLTNPSHINRPGNPRVCTLCLRTEQDGAAFSPGETGNRCKDCVAATAREWYRQNRERAAAYQRAWRKG